MDTPQRVAVGLYGLWLVAVVLLLVGRFSSLPVLPGTRAGVIVGTVIFTILGAGRLLGAGYRRIAGGDSKKE